ncbi:MAG: thiamine-phosphate kinase [Elusimicrobia bacterium RIFCSPHIGHO2_01_FULL_64_10]|nr:MAG: thiamine-phosphate kinase [Elusimicrobia bacterium RIFCSPHIGHO2_01_FULL_64_10]
MTQFLSAIGERPLLKKIEGICRPRPATLERLKRKHRANPLVPLGDDAYVVNMATPSRLVFTTDTLIQGTHFRPEDQRRFLPESEMWKCLGSKAMAVNLSDLAAMGRVEPLFALVTIGFGGDISVDTVDNLYKGMMEYCRYFDFIIAGGDIIRSDLSIVSICIVGKLMSTRPVMRKGAVPGDVLMASGPIGLSSAGMEILERQGKSLETYEKTLLRAHLLPVPRLKEGGILAGEDIMATSMLDASDDLATSLEILGGESRVGFDVDLSRVPVHPALSSYAAAAGRSPWHWIIFGGEDYELLFTVKPSRAPRVLGRLPRAYVLGTVKPPAFGIRFRDGSRPVRLKDRRFRHF